jgi:unsaturated rhamnogalacturonyl hydrolase
MPPSSKVMRVFRMLLLLASVGAVLPCIPSFGQEKTPSEFFDTVGDAPDVALPLATDLSPALNRIEVEKAMLKVADWQLERARQGFNQDWTFAVLYSGFMAVSEITGNPKYRDAMLVVGKEFKWQMGSEYKDANDQALGRTYLELYLRYRAPEMIANVRTEFDQILRGPPEPPKIQLPWWWCDALFMAPPAWARMYKATGDITYLDYLDREWWATSGRLYDRQEHLYFRDARYLNSKQANGKKIFWSRGNGWVMAGMAGVLEYMPDGYPERQRFVEQFQQMSAAIAAVQGSDGLWRTGLLDPDSYPLPENSGSAFFTYALAWGINHKVLNPSVYAPVVAKAWKGLLSHIYSDGRFGCIQSVADSPGNFKPTSSYVYGVGAFLLAGSEVDRLSLQQGYQTGTAAK